MTNGELIRDALGMLGILGESETASAEQSAHGLRVLNDMLFDWANRGVDMQWAAQSSGTATLPINERDVQAVRSALAVALGPFYGKEPSPLVYAMADSGYARLLRENQQRTMPQALMDHLPMAEGQWGNAGTYDINRGV